MRKKSASGVLASLRGSTYRSVRLASSLTAALLDGLFAHPAGYSDTDTTCELIAAYYATIEFFRSLLGAVFICLRNIRTLRCRTSSIACAVLLSVFCLAGCGQDSPPPSKERTVSLLLELLRDEAPEMRRMAAESLGKVGDPRAVDSILLLKHDPAAMVREASVLAMGRLKPTATDGVVALLTQALEDPHESVRQAAVVAIGEVEPDPRLLQPIVGLLHSSDATIRRTVVRALLQIDSSQWVPSLVAAGGDADAEVRQGIVAALGEWGGAAASSWIRERLIEDPSPGVRAEAAYRLGLLGDSEARAALNRTITKDPDSGVRRWAKRGM